MSKYLSRLLQYSNLDNKFNLDSKNLVDILVKQQPLILSGNLKQTANQYNASIYICSREYNKYCLTHGNTDILGLNNIHLMAITKSSIESNFCKVEIACANTIHEALEGIKPIEDEDSD